MRNPVIYILILIACSNCNKNTERVTLSFDLESFNHVILNNPFNVILHESEDFRIDITAAEDRQQFIEYTVTDHQLEISNTKKLGWLAPKKNEVTLHIYAPQLALVEAEETCYIQTANPITTEEFGIILKSKVNEADLDLHCGTFYFWNNSPAGGKLTLSGECHITKIWNHALMSVDARNLTTDYALVENHSKGDVKIAPLETLEYGIFDVGDILLYSAPGEIILIEDAASGELIEVN